MTEKTLFSIILIYVHLLICIKNASENIPEKENFKKIHNRVLALYKTQNGKKKMEKVCRQTEDQTF